MSSSNGRKGKYSKTVIVAMTDEMYAHLVTAAKGPRKVPNLIRNYIRHGLDQHGDIAGSRRYFTGRFRDAVKFQRLEMRWFMTVLLILLSQGLSLIILGLHTDLDEEKRKQFSGPALFKVAVARADTEGHRLLEQLDNLLLDKALTEDADI
jgi:hypothetical protein